MNFLGIDIGTSSICGIVYNTVSKDIVSIAKINNTDMLSCNVWEKVQDANAIVDVRSDPRTSNPISGYKRNWIIWANAWYIVC